MLLYLPAGAKAPAPLFVGLNFHGNQAVAADPAIAIAHSWVAAPGKGIVKHRATAASRGIEAGQWPIAQILAAGYGVATFFPGDLYPDGERSEEHTSELQSLMRISSAVFCLKKKKT